MSFKVGGGFLTNSKVAWGMTSDVAEHYLEGSYIPPEGWEFKMEIEADRFAPAGYYTLTNTGH